MYILGSGASIADLSDRAFELIGKHDSIGFNFWLVHDFVPTYYLAETSPAAGRNSVFFDLLSQRQVDFANTPLILQYKHWRRHQKGFGDIPARLRNNVYLHAPWALLSPHPAVVSWQIKRWCKRRASREWRLMHLLHHRATLCLAIVFGAVCGYSKLVLVGIDLRDTRYFWEVDDRRWSGRPVPDNIQENEIHATADARLNSSLRTLPATEFLLQLKTLWLDPAGIEVTVANPESLLIDFGIQAESMT